MSIFPSASKSQQIVIQGDIRDTIGEITPAMAVISLIHKKDSTLATFTRSGAGGTFSLKEVLPGEYLLMVTYPGYADYVEEVSLVTGDLLTDKTIFITPRSTLLDEVLVRQNEMSVRGDTTEYFAKQFKVKKNATVEDLLKQLPGIQVNEQGHVIAQGRKIEKILVDGEEFFSDDPTIATRNIRADAVKKVQVFDKKSEQADFSGVNDGKSSKTLNLELEESAKRGYFGKLSAGALDKYYNAQAVVNSFKGKRQFSGFLITGTTDNTGLKGEEAESFGFSNQNVTVDEGSGTIFIHSSDQDDFDAGNFEGEGLPNSTKGGLHYSNKWMDDRYHVSGNYLFNNLIIDNKSNTIRRNFLEDSIYYNTEKVVNHSDNLFNGLKTRFGVNIDSTSSLIIHVKGKASRYKSDSKIEAEALGGNKEKKNSSNRRYSRKGDIEVFNIDAIYRKKFKKPGRTLSMNIKNGFFQEQVKSILFNFTEFQVARPSFIGDSINQRKENDNKNSHLQTSLAFTEKISAHASVELNYSWFQIKAREDRVVFEKNRQGYYNIPVDELTDEFRYSYNIHTGGLLFSMDFPKVNFTLGGRYNSLAYHNKLFKAATEGNNRSVNFFPAANFSYKISPGKFLKLTYHEQSHQPQMHQLQPIVNNTDPVNIFAGNPDLKQEIEKSLQVNFSNYNTLKERYLFVTSEVTYTPGMFSLDHKTDAGGKRSTRYVNSEGFLAVIAAGYNFKLQGTKIRLGLTPSLSYASFPNYINGRKNVSNLWFSSVRLNWGYYGDVLQVDGFIAPENNFSTYSINKEDKTNLWNLKSTTYLSLNLPAKFETGLTFNLYLREKLASFDQNNNAAILNAYIEKRFLENEALALRIAIKDVFNQNIGFARNVYSFYTEERRYSTISRYGLLSLTYNFFNKEERKSNPNAPIKF